MKHITREFRAVAEYLRKEFGSVTKCDHGLCAFTAPPVGAKFEVMEPLETEPHPIEIKRNTEFGLTEDSCIPPGIYDGIEEDGILAGTATHNLFISGSKKYKTKKVCVRVVSGNIDWRGVRAIKS